MTSPLRGLGIAIALAVAMFAAQAIGLEHRVAHAPGLEHTHDEAGVGHHDAPECRLYDQLAHGDALPAGASPTVLLPFVELPQAAHAASRIAAQAAGARARGPPLIG